ncbi:sigma-54-dependent transcriptional regulator [Actibacterium pelagium]|uniref:Sigma-54-dependent Fis family transcriptional regulator n=1 Tax=Actibacterium pelagium TaxID=2029103 RepID=A0A917EGT8_9RHOB|nr:sigma-54 dependent transcriptional regulator [Actibacterium pelagium]GGE37894.1 sigma-54-dependent Fis family transcriptional regulator [Actibacterium pelagium]
MNKGDVLVVDDDREMRVSLSHLLGKAGYGVTCAGEGNEALKLLREGTVDVVLSDVQMPGMDGLEFQRKAAELSSVPIVLFSAHGDIPMAVEAIQNGAYNFLEKPFDPRRLLTLVGNATRLKRLMDSTSRLEKRLSSLTDLEQILIGDSPGIVAIRQKIHDFAESPANVLVTGGTGTGKELVARALHDLGKGPGAPFVAVNCAVIPPDRFEETVFGSTDRPSGFMQRANGGTLFLDELTSMPVETQSKFLRVIETKLCEPLGADTPVEVDVRIISAASEDPQAAVAEGRMRQDLVFRLNTLVIDLPSLVDRGEDTLLVFRHYLQRLSSVYDVPVPELSNSDYKALLSHDWPGNVRELQSVAERFVLASKRGGSSVQRAIQGEDDGPSVPQTLREAVAAFERQIISQAIMAQEGRMDDAAAQLGIGRRTLNEKIVKLGIDKSGLLAAE